MLDDALQGLIGARQVGDRPKVRPAEGGLVGLLERRAYEQPVRAHRVSQVGEPPFDSTVEVPYRGEVLGPRHDILGQHSLGREPSRFEAWRIGALHPFRPLQVYEVLQCRLPEGEQPELHPGRVAPRLVWHMGPAHIGGGPNGREKVLHHRPMHHLLGGDCQDHLAPALDGRQLIVAKTGTRRALETERGVEVLAHQGVLELSSLGEKIGELLAALHHDGRLFHNERNVPQRQPPATARAPAGGLPTGDTCQPGRSGRTGFPVAMPYTSSALRAMPLAWSCSSSCWPRWARTWSRLSWR